MEAFVIRQPIFDPRERVFAYRLLFRNSLDDLWFASDPASKRSGPPRPVCSPPDLQRLTGGRPAFVRVTRRFLEKNLASLFAHDWLVVELPPETGLDAGTLPACRELKEAGYTLALGDLESQPDLEPLLPLADIVKADFGGSEAETQSTILSRARSGGAKLLAEGVETREDFHRARDRGFDYFQGNFFSRPASASGDKLPSWRTQALRLMRKMQEPTIDYHDLAAIFREEVSLTYRLLRYVNSPYFGVRLEISSVEHALSLLGENLIRKWVMLAAMDTVSQDGPAEMARMSFIRALLCESLGAELGAAERLSDCFLVGLFSMLDLLFGRPLADLLAELPLSVEVTQALSAREGFLGQVLELAVSYETGDWDRFSLVAGEIGLDQNILPRLYLQAVTWAGDLTSNDR